MIYTIPVSLFSTSGTANVEKTAIAIAAPNTAGKRFMLIGLILGFGDATADDEQVGIYVRSEPSAPSGTGTTITPVKTDPEGPPSTMTAKVNFTTEPSAYDAIPRWVGEVNSRSFLPLIWTEKEAQKFTKNMQCGILLAPRSSKVRVISATARILEY